MSATTRIVATTSLIAVLIWASVVVWREWLARIYRRQPLLEMNSEPRATWRSIPEMTAIYIALLWVVLHLCSPFLKPANSPEKPLVLSSVAIVAAVNLGVSLLLALMLVSGRRRGSLFGMTTVNLSDQVRIGIKGYCAAVLPTALSMLVTSSIRRIELQHSLLKLLAESPDPVTVTVIAVTAVVSAPLLEELLFRVILQGTLSSIFPAWVAISAVACLFALVHGWRDGLALLPLAFILGYVYHRCHSYLAVVLIHASFNATMLIVQLMNPPIPVE